jgi:hypothetical protein
MPRVEIAIAEQLLDELSEGFFVEESRGALFHEVSEEALESIRKLLESEIVSPEDDGFAAEKIVARVYGLSIKIWADEHPPPHFHVSYQGEDASFSILDCSRLRGVGGLERYDHVIRAWWAKNHSLLIKEWNASRPTECPVGPINLPSR